MTDKGSYITSCYCHRDTNLDHIGEERHTVLKEMVGDLHDTGRMLDDGYLGAFQHFQGGVHEAINGDTGIGVDDEDDFSASPSAPFIAHTYIRMFPSTHAGHLFFSTAISLASLYNSLSFASDHPSAPLGPYLCGRK